MDTKKLDTPSYVARTRVTVDHGQKEAGSSRCSKRARYPFPEKTQPVRSTSEPKEAFGCGKEERKGRVGTTWTLTSQRGREGELAWLRNVGSSLSTSLWLFI